MVAVSCCVVGASSQAEAKAPYRQIEQGVSYAAGARVGAEATSIVVPRGWTATWPAGAEVLSLTSAKHPEVQVLVSLEPSLTRASAIEQLSQPIPVSAQAALVPAGAPSSTREGLAQSYSPNVDAPVFGEARVVLEGKGGGRGVVVMALGQKAHRAAGEGAAAAVAGSVRFHARPKPTRSGAFGKLLKGKRVVYMKTKSGHSVQKRFDFCADGSVGYYYEESYISGGFTSSSDDAKEGVWSVRGSTLEIAWSDRTTGSWSLTRKESGGVSLDGRKNWFIDGPARCQ
jgi:hypothetical protein